MIFLRLDPLFNNIEKREENPYIQRKQRLYQKMRQINDVYDDVALGRYRPNNIR
jgi:hypothetical protein